MIKKIIFLFVFGLVNTVYAQNFWSFDESGKQSPIPVQCDGQFDADLGVVFMPSASDLYSYGEMFLSDTDEEVRAGAAYCFVAAVLQGSVEAQYKLAQMYATGNAVQQSDLSAYKWAFLSALSGNVAGQELALELEKYLTTGDIAAATKDIQTVLDVLKENKTKDLESLTEHVQQRKEYLNEVNSEIDVLLGIPVIETKPVEKSVEDTVIPSAKGIFNKDDRMKL